MTARKEDNVWDGMPRVQFEALKKYVGYLADEMKLADWNFQVSLEPSGEDAWAEISITWGRKWAIIAVCKDFLKLKSNEQRHAMVHELIHCHNDGARALIRTAITEQFGQLSWGLLSNGLQREIELATDGLADVIAPHLDPPNWPC